jgi:hypothetical protein
MADVPAKIIVDFTNVKESSGFNQLHQEAGDYKGVVKDYSHDLSKQNKNPMLTFQIADADRPSAVYRYQCVLTENSLWKLRNLLVAAGISVPKKKVNVASVLPKLKGKEIGMSLDDDEYEGKMRSQIVGVFPADDLADDEPPTPKKKPASKPKPTDDDDEDDTETEDDEDLDDLDIDDL